MGRGPPPASGGGARRQPALGDVCGMIRDEVPMPKFAIERSEVELESAFAPRLWSLIDGVPALYDALLDDLGSIGLSSTELRPDAGDGSVGNTCLGFGLGDTPASESGLESVRFQSSSAVPNLMVVVGAVTAAVRRLLPDFTFRSHGFSYACHGRIEGTRAVDYVRAFFQDSVAIEGFGGHLGAGIALYYGDAPPIMSSTVTLDMSRVLEDGLYVRVFMVIDEKAGTLEHVQALADERFRATLAAVKLEVS